MLTGEANEPLVIDNKALGYRLYFQLTAFVHDPARTFYAGYSRFEEMKPANGREQRKWKANRKQAYYGSVAHFMQALVKGRLKSNGFVVKRLVKVSDSVPGHRVLPTWKGDEFRSSDTVVTMLWNGQGYTASDTALTRFNLISATGSGGRIPENQYEWGRKMGFNVLYPARLPEDSIIHQAADGSGYELAFGNSLFITYTKKVIVHERWLPGITNQYAFETSLITMNVPQSSMDRHGNLADPHAFVSAGYWSTLRVADQLPVDYSPTE